MNAKLRMAVVVVGLLLVAAPVLAHGGPGGPDVSPPNTRCEVRCNVQYHRCIATCNGPKDNVECEDCCYTGWLTCMWRCDVLPPATSVFEPRPEPLLMSVWIPDELPVER